MALITLRQMLDHAAEYNYGLPAFNITNLETLRSVMIAADRTNSPVLVQASRSARSYIDDTFLRHMVLAAAEKYPHLPICLHLDHGNELSTCLSAMDNGFTSVMMDGSLMADGSTPSDFEYNASVTSSVVDVAHARGISVEGEIGVLGSLETGAGEKEDGHGFDGTLSRDQLLTDPEEAKRFVEATNVDALAVAIGTSHGAYKFSKKPDGDTLAMDVIRKIASVLPNTHLVMHGASSVPQDLQDVINAYGGEMKQTYGVPLDEVEEGIKNGVRKVNIDTDIRMAISGQMRRILTEKPGLIDLRAILKPGIERTTEMCIERFERFGSAGMADKIKPMPLCQMAERYAAGLFERKVA